MPGKPPTMRDLLDDPVYRKFVRTVPRLASNLAHGTPWAVWARKTDGRWMGGEFSTYADAWAVVVKKVRDTTFEDVAVVSKRQLFRTIPAGYRPPWGFDWCSRCRRPTTYAIRPGHHGLRKAPAITTDEPYRCYYCGARAVLASISPDGHYVDVST